ncbi:MAG: 3-oxoadipate enol-lactonase [Desulfobacteraceae bacterium]|nr:MAG: 3-oxoadipate enol-lactonase [Desulfobacteraceae bacterium]
MHAAANGIRIHYELDGDPSAPVITLSHSLATDLSMWEHQMETLLRSYRVLRYDTRGHGGTEAPEGHYSLQTLADDVRALLHELGIGKTHFMGISMGGMIAQHLALDSPEIISSLILCDTSSRVDKESWPVWDERIRVAQTKGMEPHVSPTLERWFTPSFRERNPEVLGKIGDMIRKTEPRGYIGCSYAIRALDLTDRLGKIRTPSLIIVGEDDPGTPVPAARTIHERLKGSELVIIESASHLSNIEQSGKFNDAVMSFLSGI